MSEWAPNAKIIHIDVDPAEISKNRARPHRHRRPGGAGPGRARRGLPGPARAPRRRPRAPPGWTRSRRWKRQHPYQVDTDPGAIQPQQVVQSLYRITRGEAIICTDVGQHQMWAAQHYLFDRPRRWITSGGLGTMGFGLPAALGAQVALPDELVIDDLRRRLVRDDPAGALDRPDVRPAGQGRDPEQRLPGHGPPVAGALLGGPLRRHQLRALPAELRGIAARLRRSTAHDRARRPASSRTPSPRRSPPTGRRWSTCTSTRWPRSSRWSPRARGPTRSWSGARRRWGPSRTPRSGRPT